MSDHSWSHRLHEFTDVSAPLLDDPGALASLLVASGGALGTSALAPPLVRRGPDGLVAALLCNDGHILLHASPSDRHCLVSIVARSDRAIDRGLDVMVRRLAAEGR